MNLTDWIGREERVTDLVTSTPHTALSATLDASSDRVVDGAPLPPLWHWLYTLPIHRTGDLGPDGHAKRGGFLPPVPLPRRMWAGGRFRFARPILVGDRITRESRIESVADKTGRTGRLCLVTVRHTIFVNGDIEPAVTELQDLVYREAPRGDEKAARLPSAEPEFERQIMADDVLLFRYSALTFNAHRIHYDRRYATAIEGYPGLVVQAPLLATLLLDLLGREVPGATVETFEFRAVRPTFDTHPFRVCGARVDGNKVRLWSKDHEGWVGIDALATLRTEAGVSRGASLDRARG